MLAANYPGDYAIIAFHPESNTRPTNSTTFLSQSLLDYFQLSVHHHLHSWYRYYNYSILSIFDRFRLIWCIWTLRLIPHGRISLVRFLPFRPVSLSKRYFIDLDLNNWIISTFISYDAPISVLCLFSPSNYLEGLPMFRWAFLKTIFFSITWWTTTSCFYEEWQIARMH